MAVRDLVGDRLCFAETPLFDGGEPILGAWRFAEKNSRASAQARWLLAAPRHPVHAD